jgi:tellurite resistance protein TerA
VSAGGADPGGVSLSKVTLTKSAPSVSLSKGGGAHGHLRVNLNWTSKPASSGGGGGFFKKLLSGGGSSGIDLDLAALYELADGRKGVVQALGNTFGNLDGPPYVKLDADDRTGSSAAGETLFINLDHTADIRRILVFAFIYEGVPAWDQANAVVTLYPVAGPPIEVVLDETRAGARTCAIAMLQNTGGDLTVSREVRYIDGAQDKLDAAYNWGLDWRPGRK